jgi:GT2 family glycosyltransferase
MTKSSKPPQVGLIIVNWNGLEHLKISLPSLQHQTDKNLTVYVVDNNSKDDSVKWMKKEHPEVVIIEAGKNLGFAGGNNLGIERALADGVDYTMLLNNDTEVEPDLVKNMVDYMEKNKKVGIIQPKLLLMDYRDTTDSCGSWLTKTGFLIHFGCEEKDGPLYSVDTPIFTIKGAAMMVRRVTLEKIGLFDDDFFAYFEETDLCWRSWLHGYEVHYAPVGIVYHKIGGSTKQIGSPVINYHSFKNRIMSLIKNLETKNLVWILPIHTVLIIGFSFIYFLAGRGRSGLSIYLAIGWNIAHFKENLAKRKEIQAARVIGDDDLFKIIMQPVNWQESFDFSRRYFIEKKKSDLIAAGKWKGK